MQDIEQGIARITDIRARLAASTCSGGCAAEALVIIAVMSALVASAQAIWPEHHG